jgi:hypothetical protein
MSAAGTGRDAAWLASHEVVAVEPAAAMRRKGQNSHQDPEYVSAIGTLVDREYKVDC